MLVRSSAFTLAALTTLLSSTISSGQNTIDTATTSFTLPTGATITGITAANPSGELYEAFLGIQYAQVGERFSRSELLNLPTTDMNATSFGYDCPQMYSGLPPLVHEVHPELEECLYLNIWRPQGTTSADRLAVMVYIHGGGFAIGSGADSINDGRYLATDQNVIVVTLNYRLGALGLMPQDPESGYGGLNSIYDQIQALKWINENIAAFGGLDTEITVFGNSAGAESICMLSVSPLAQGLFSRAIMQSGGCVNNNWSHGIPTPSDYGYNLTQTLLGMLQASSLEDLMNVTLYSPSDLNTMSLGAGWPVVALDKEVLPDYPSVLYKDSQNVVPLDILIGSNAYEDVMVMGIVTPDVYQSMAENLEVTISTSMEPKYGTSVVQDLLEVYDPTHFKSSDHVLALARFNADYYIGCPALEHAKIVTENGNVYLYEFAHYSADTDPAAHFGYDYLVTSEHWASHLAEIPFVFGTLDFALADPSKGVDPVDEQLSKEMRTRWANFAKYGNPYINSDDEDNDDVAVEQHEWAMLAMGEEIPLMMFENGNGLSTSKDQIQCSAFPYVEPWKTTEDVPSKAPVTRICSLLSLAAIVGAMIEL